MFGTTNFIFFMFGHCTSPKQGNLVIPVVVVQRAPGIVARVISQRRSKEATGRLVGSCPENGTKSAARFVASRSSLLLSAKHRISCSVFVTKYISQPLAESPDATGWLAWAGGK
jgi:hypothetical protein